MRFMGAATVVVDHMFHRTSAGFYDCTATPQNAPQAAETILAIPSQGQTVANAVQSGMATRRDKNNRQ